MKTQMRQKLVICNSFLFLFFAITVMQFINCSNATTIANVGYGKSFFYKNCGICHNRKYDGSDGTPGLLTFNNYDSLSLDEKLRGIKLDSIHGVILYPLKYSDKEIVSLNEFIKEYFKPSY